MITCHLLYLQYAKMTREFVANKKRLKAIKAAKG